MLQSIPPLAISMDNKLIFWALGLSLLTPQLGAQTFLYSVDNDYPGTSYLGGDTETGGSFYVDGNLNMSGSLMVDSTGANNNLYVENLHAGVPLDGNQTDFIMDGPLQLWSGFSPGMPALKGAALSWLHSQLDLGDLTYTSTDTPALNISENGDGTYLYPTIYFTGYDGNTTWVWQQNGLDAVTLSNASLLAQQMELESSGNLTLANAGNSTSVQIISETGQVNFSTAPVHLRATATASNNLTLVTGNAAVVFWDASGNTTQNLTAANVTTIYGNGVQGFGFGHDIGLTASRSFALGNGLSADYYGSIVLGADNIAHAGLTSANRTAWQSADPLFIVGNGGATDALTIYKNGNAEFGDSLTVDGQFQANGTTTIPGDVWLNPDATPGAVTVTVSSAKGNVSLIGE